MPRSSKAMIHPFKSFHSDWLQTLETTILPRLRHAISSSSTSSTDVHRIEGGALLPSSDLLSLRVRTIHSHFQAYYEALDAAAQHDPTQILAPEWCKPLEKPFLWLGGFHPSVFTNLFRSFIQNPRDGMPDSSSSSSISLQFMPKVHHLQKAMRIERGIKGMAPTLFQRYTDAQVEFMHGAAEEWVCGGDRGEERSSASSSRCSDVETVLTSVLRDANRLRSGVLSEIVEALEVDESALYFEALAEFVLGFGDDGLLREVKY